MTRLLLCAVVAGFALSGFAGAKDVAAAKTEPAGVPLEITITGKKTTFPLDLDGKTSAEFEEVIKKAKEAGGPVPKPPAVDFVVTIKNTGKDTIMVHTSGDPVVLTLELKGKGAINVEPALAFTTDFRLPQGVGLGAGKTIEIPVKSLTSGFRGASKMAYWTAPGEYELVATWVTGVSPVPKGAEDNGEGYGKVTLTSAPLKITVEGK
jgi:hypothetical protein